MIPIASYNPDSGAILSISMVDPRSLEYYTDPYIIIDAYVQGLDDTHYVADGQLCAYTPEELTTKRSVPYGCKWDTKLRKVVDARTPEQKSADELQLVLNQRAKAYPPLADFADALYWQEKGDSSKMNAYLAACEAVKVQYPKPS